jgi:multiple sugar transport system substrate-binding protein
MPRRPFRTLLVAAGLALTPAGARAADLTVWWAKGYYPAQDEGVRRVVEDFRKDTGTSVELTFHPESDLPVKLRAALEAGQPPDVSNATSEFSPSYRRWAYEGRFVDLGDIVEPIAKSIDPVLLEAGRLPNGRTGERAYYSVPLEAASIHVHVWRSLLEQAGLDPERIPREWTAFWAFFCETAQPAVRKATGKRNVYGVGLPSSTVADDTAHSFMEFQLAHDAWFVDADGRLLFDRPGMRQHLIEALEDFTRPSRRGCNPPGAVSWGDPDNNANFLNQTIVMTPNPTLSVPGSQRTSNPENYYKNIATIPWPNALDGKPLPLLVLRWGAEVYAAGRNPEGGKAFLRYLIRPERLGPLVEAAQGRYYPALRELADGPFWTDPADPHRVVLRRQMTDNPRLRPWERLSLGLEQVYAERVWSKAIDRIILEGWTAERAADEAIAGTRQIVGG